MTYSDLTTVLETATLNHSKFGKAKAELVHVQSVGYGVWLTLSNGKVHEQQFSDEASARKFWASIRPEVR